MSDFYDYIKSNSDIYKTAWYLNQRLAVQKIIYYMAEGLLSDEFLQRMRIAAEELITSKKKVVLEVEEGKLVYKVRDLDDVIFDRLNYGKEN
jgi:uncharacterized protein YoaH (UPF0181 family)